MDTSTLTLKKQILERIIDLTLLYKGCHLYEIYIERDVSSLL